MRRWLKEYRKKENITQQMVAEKSNISQGTYALIERDLRNPSVNTAKKIAKILKFDWTEFYK